MASEAQSTVAAHDAIAALPLPGADALAAALREAEKRGIERAAELTAKFRGNVQNELDHAKSAQAESGLAAAVSALDEIERAIRALLEDRA